MKAQYDGMKENYDVLQAKLNVLQQQITSLEQRDNEVYRSIFEATPLPDSARANIIEKKKEVEKVQAMNDDKLGNELAKTLNNVSARINYQFASYTEIEKLIKNQGE